MRALLGTDSHFCEVAVLKFRTATQALEENLRRAEREGDLNLGLGPEWEAWTSPDDTTK